MIIKITLEMAPIGWKRLDVLGRGEVCEAQEKKDFSRTRINANFLVYVLWQMAMALL